MRGFLSLLRKETRDVRTLTWVYALLLPAAMLGIRWYLGMWYEGFVTTGDVIPRHLEPAFPAAVWLLAAFVASDLVAGDVASRRMHQLALLPVRPLTVWTAKVAVLVAATSLIAVWAYASQWGALAAVDGLEHAALFEQRALRDWEVLIPAVAALGSVLLVSTMGLRGIGAVLGGAMLCGALGVAYAWGRSEPRWIVGDDWIWVFVACGALWVASAVAFVRGRVHLQERWRPALVGGAALAALFGVPAVGLAAVARHVVPGSSLCTLVEYAASPRAPYVALTYANRLDDDAGSATFVLSLDDGSLRECEPGGRFGGWQDDGTLVVQRYTEDSTVVGAFVDPATGRSVRPKVQPWPERVAEILAQTDATRKRVWWQVTDGPEPGVWKISAKGRPERLVRSVVRPASFGQVNLGLRWFAVAPDADRLVKLDAETGEETPLFASPGVFEGARVFSPDAKGTALVRGERWSWIDFATQRVHELPAEIRAVHFAVAPGRPGCLMYAALADTPCVVLDPLSGRILRLDGGRWDTNVAVHDGGIALVRGDGTFERYDASLNRVEVKRLEVTR